MVAFATDLLNKEEYMSFKDYATHILQEEFGLKWVENPLLEKWLDTPVNIAEDTRTKLEQLRKDAVKRSAFLNEAELRFYLIDPIIRLAGLVTEEYRPFLERTLVGEVDGKKMRGKVDLIIAKGDIHPQAPYLFIHEYKKEQGSSNDVVAQLLAAMLVAQSANDNQKPVYGCYLIGKLWHFVILDQRNYCISDGHVASSDDIFEIYQGLVNMKSIIEKELLR